MSDTADISLYDVTPRQARRECVEIMEAGLVPFLESSPGMGKSSLFASICDEYGMDLIDYRLSTAVPEDFNGLPRFDEDGMAYFAPFAKTFPVKGISQMRKNQNGWLLFMDEANHGTKLVQSASYKVVLDKAIGQFDLHENVMIAMAGNLASDRANVQPMSTALESRVVKLTMRLDFDEFLEDVAIPQEWDSRVIAYLNYKGGLRTLMDFKPDYKERGEKSFNSPRTWDFVNRMCKGKKVEARKAATFAGTLTSGTAADFVQFCAVMDTQISIKEVMADPKNCPLPSDNGSRWGVTTHLLEHVTEDTLDSVSEFIDRFDITYRILFYRGVRLKPKLRAHPAFTKRIVELSNYLN